VVVAHVCQTLADYLEGRPVPTSEFEQLRAAFERSIEDVLEHSGNPAALEDRISALAAAFTEWVAA